ncbi:hypothetical protein GWK47_014957 [Chionoecetes opilio]|uniref:Uncharacterized protein n=1 Tax=Chionoecetes opilio TaxID=41210 RepID=A0A8J5CIJ0_CHIOP|nr:hypothetical protein GWK47_014957 [Chionoecetes opilio]
MDVDAQGPRDNAGPGPLAMAAIGGELRPAEAPRNDAVTQCRPLTSLVESGTQMEGRLYTFGERDLLVCLGYMSNLVSQETVAICSRVSHQSAFFYVRQALREGRRPGVRLPRRDRLTCRSIIAAVVNVPGGGGGGCTLASLVRWGRKLTNRQTDLDTCLVAAESIPPGRRLPAMAVRHSLARVGFQHIHLPQRARHEA